PSSAVSGVTFSDDIPSHDNLLSYTGPGGAAVDESSFSGGAFGKGRARFSNISIPAGGTASITITVRVDSRAQFVASGVPAASIHGTSVCNQGTVSAGFITTPLQTDDPSTGTLHDATCFTLTYAPLFGTSAKGAVDDDGGILEPGDTITYTI